jgi:DNA polymerase III epsilon subunit-like protein
MARHSNPPDRAKVQAWAQSLFALPNFYILDTETTGLDKTDEVVQIGIIDKNGEIILDTLVKPSKPVPFQATNIHGITNEMLADAPTLDDIYVSLSAKLAGTPLVAYNMDFDWRLLSQTVTRYQLPLFRTGKRHCAMKQYAKFRGVKGKRGYRWHKLGDAATYEKITVKNAHSALGDVIMTLELMKKMAE